MQSPSPVATSKLDTVDLTSLSLEPVLNTTSNSHIFAFESGATWGSSGGTGNNDWSYPSGEVFSNEGQPATFLSLSSTNAWGPSVSGFGGTTLAGPSLNGEPTSSTGD